MNDYPLLDAAEVGPLPAPSRRIRVSLKEDHRSWLATGKLHNVSTSHSRLAEMLNTSALFLEFQRAFEDATGLPLTLRPVQSWRLAHAGSRRQNGFCALLSHENRSCSACLALQQKACENANGASATLNCVFGLSETAVGVRLGHDILAYLQTGQVFLKPPTPEQTRHAMKQIREWGLNLDPAKAARSYQETPVVPRTEYEAQVRLLEFFARQLGALANQMVLQQTASEPPQISRARQWIEGHCQEDLGLASVARQSGMSAWYLCKRFKQSTFA